jgi:hypothetical protein
MLDSSQRQPIVDTSRSPHVRLRPLPLEAVKLADNFWEPRRRINRDVTLPSQYRHLEETGRLDNFRRASGKIGGTRYPVRLDGAHPCLVRGGCCGRSKQ